MNSFCCRVYSTVTTIPKILSSVELRSKDLHGNGDDGNANRGNGNHCCGNTVVMGTVVAVIPRERLLLKRYYPGSGHRIL